MTLVRRDALGVAARGLSAALVVWGLSARPLGAQATVASVPRERETALAEQVKSELEQARWRLGPIRLLPRLSIGDAGYTNNVAGSADDERGDYTATASAGVRWLVPVGRKVALRGDAVPSYTWYHRTTELRRYGWDASASLLGFFNRASVRVLGRQSRSTRPLTSEEERPATETRTEGEVEIEVETARKLYLVAGATGERQRFREDVFSAPRLVLPELDVDVVSAHGGLTFKFAAPLAVGLELERRDFDYRVSPLLRNHQTTGYLLTARFDTPKAFVNLSGGLREAKALDGSSFPEYREATGSAFFSWYLTRTVELQAFGARLPVASLVVDNPYFLETRWGGAVKLHAGRRWAVAASAERGDNRYPRESATPGGGRVKRRDEATSFGGALSFAAFGDVTFNASASRTTYSSNVPGFDRSILRFSATLGFGVAPAP